ncbi:MAG: immunoglobulin-like domain-containing protein [Schleiferilactobacillus harbinensis]|uniref:SLAP domain-containing protein n=1 Tax=Schleiferilactobacillus harbinensis TaxID=304207 RepID=UPI0039ECC96A
MNNTIDASVATTTDTFSNLFVKSGVATSVLGTGNKLSFSAKEFTQTKPEEIAREFAGNSRSTYNFTIKLTDGKGNLLASKDVVLTIARNSNVAASAATYGVGDSLKSLDSGTNTAAAVTLTDRDGKKIQATDGDLENLNYKSTPTFSETGTSLDQVKYLGSGSQEGQLVSTNGSTFSNPGVFYQAFDLKGDLFKNGNKYSNVDTGAFNHDYKVNDGRPYVDGSGNVWVLRKVTVTAGTNDQAYYPVFKYTTGTESSASNQYTETYFNGDTITPAGKTFYAGVKAGVSDSADLANIGKYLEGLATGINGKADNPANGTFEGFENSIKNGGLVEPLESRNGISRYTIAGVRLSDSGFDTKLVSALADLIPNNYKAQSVKVPVTVTNARGLTSTVYIPVTIGTNVGTPIATEFTGYSEVTKGSSFDPLADVQFANSSTDNGVIPSGRIQVSSNVDTTTPGTYTVTYTVTNSAGQTATFKRTVVVTAGALTESNASGVVYINNASGAKVYSDTATSKETGNTLDNTTAWKYFSVVKDNAGKIVAYNLGGKQYVKASEVSTSPVKAQAGLFTVHYPANSKWSIAVYNSDLKVIKLIPAKSSWLTFGTKTLKDGKSYYNLGGNQWVRTDYGFWNAK